MADSYVESEDGCKWQKKIDTFSTSSFEKCADDTRDGYKASILSKTTIERKKNRER